MPGMSTASADWPRAGRNGVDDLLADDALQRGRLHVDDRRFAGHRDRFLDRADASSRRRRVAVNEPVSSMPSRLNGAEPRQGEGHRIRAGAQIDDSILTRAIGDDGTDLLDQRGARGLDGHARQQGRRLRP